VRLDVMSSFPIPKIAGLLLAARCEAAGDSRAKAAAANEPARVLVDDPAINCTSCTNWKPSLPPFQVFGTTW